MKNHRRRGLTPEEWQTMAAKLRDATEALATLDSLLSESQTVAGLAPYRKVFGKVQSLRSRLDSLAIQQHPAMSESTKLFYGDGWTYHAAWR